MLYRDLLTSELDRQREDFRRFADAQADDLTDYQNKLKVLSRTPLAEILRKLSNKDAGAIPSNELERNETFTVSFAEQSWTNHEAARGWANEILKNRTTFAADGSQLFVEREVSLPVAAIQIGWFENPHDERQGYEKNARFFVLSPEDLLKDQEEPVIPETRVGQRRFEAEVEKAKEFLLKKKGWQERGERMPLAFYDGTLLISFAMPRTELQTGFVTQLVNLVKLSRDARVPIIGYVDRSYARDLLGLLDEFDGDRQANKRTVDDASLLHATLGGDAPILKNWGDRTVFCLSQRRILKDYFVDERTGEPLVGFCYLQTTSDSPPARLDIPAWIYEAGLLDEVCDAARAECVVGLGYPYALETADQTAVINLRDREIFLQTLQGFAKRNNLDFRFSRKAASKGRRR